MIKNLSPKSFRVKFKIFIKTSKTKYKLISSKIKHINGTTKNCCNNNNTKGNISQFNQKFLTICRIN